MSKSKETKATKNIQIHLHGGEPELKLLAKEAKAQKAEATHVAEKVELALKKGQAKDIVHELTAAEEAAVVQVLSELCDKLGLNAKGRPFGHGPARSISARKGGCELSLTLQRVKASWVLSASSGVVLPPQAQAFVSQRMQSILHPRFEGELTWK